MTICDLARHLGVSEWMIRNIEKEYLKRHFEKPRLKDVRMITIDEICIGSGHRYLTIVIDHFHVIKLFNDKLSKLRRALFNEAADKLHENILKRTRWLLLKNPENLKEEKEEQKRLNKALELNKPLRKARTGLLNWYDYPISTGPLEGTNNKIKTMQRQAYGYRDREYFRLKLFALHESE